MQTLQELAFLQFVWPSPLQANLGYEGQEYPAAQKYDENINGNCEHFFAGT